MFYQILSILSSGCFYLYSPLDESTETVDLTRLAHKCTFLSSNNKCLTNLHWREGSKHVQILEKCSIMDKRASNLLTEYLRKLQPAEGCDSNPFSFFQLLKLLVAMAFNNAIVLHGSLPFDHPKAPQKKTKRNRKTRCCTTHGVAVSCASLGKREACSEICGRTFRVWGSSRFNFRSACARSPCGKFHCPWNIPYQYI